MKWYLDFGHGGKDSGAVSANQTKESNIVLKIGMLVKNNLEKAGEEVVTTREKDLYYSLDYRTSKANKENCDYFISLHMNSSTNKSFILSLTLSSNDLLDNIVKTSVL